MVGHGNEKKKKKKSIMLARDYLRNDKASFPGYYSGRNMCSIKPLHGISDRDGGCRS